MDTEQLLDVACELLAIPSTADRPADLQRALDFVIDFAGPGFTVERFESEGKASALLYLGAVRPRFKVILNAHLDVIPAKPEQFRPRREGQRLYARGAQDMKVSALVLALVFRELAPRLAYPLGLQLVTDEEVGGHNGTLHQLECGVNGDFAVIGEFSGLNIVTESKGMIIVTLQAKGMGAHSAYPWLGDNAILKIHRSLSRIFSAYPPPISEVWRTTVSVSRIETSNQAYNQIPSDAEALLDIRFSPDDPALNGKTADEILEFLTGFCEPGVVPALKHASGIHLARSDNSHIKDIQSAVSRQGYRSESLRRHGASDGRFYTQYDTDAILFGVDGAGQHGPDEYVDVSSVAPYKNALMDFLKHSNPA